MVIPNRIMAMGSGMSFKAPLMVLGCSPNEALDNEILRLCVFKSDANCVVSRARLNMGFAPRTQCTGTEECTKCLNLEHDEALFSDATALKVLRLLRIRNGEAWLDAALRRHKELQFFTFTNKPVEPRVYELPDEPKANQSKLPQPARKTDGDEFKLIDLSEPNDESYKPASSANTAAMDPLGELDVVAAKRVEAGVKRRTDAAVIAKKFKRREIKEVEAITEYLKSIKGSTMPNIKPAATPKILTPEHSSNSGIDIDDAASRTAQADDDSLIDPSERFEHANMHAPLDEQRSLTQSINGHCNFFEPLERAFALSAEAMMLTGATQCSPEEPWKNARLVSMLMELKKHIADHQGCLDRLNAHNAAAMHLTEKLLAARSKTLINDLGVGKEAEKR